ncbi:MAG: hypothetical protein AAGJ18_07665, partial [Bacteroidota bacterium]
EIKGKIKTLLEIFKDLLIYLPNASTNLLMSITKYPKPTVIALKKAFHGKNKNDLLKIGRPLFEPIPNMDAERWKEADQFLLDLWKTYKKAIQEKRVVEI